MVQSIDVIVIFDKIMKEPKPVRFKIYDCGHWKSVNVDRIYNTEVQFEPLTEANIWSGRLDTTMGALIGFLRYYPNRDLFNWQIEEETTQDII